MVFNIYSLDRDITPLPSRDAPAGVRGATLAPPPPPSPSLSPPSPPPRGTSGRSPVVAGGGGAISSPCVGGAARAGSRRWGCCARAGHSGAAALWSRPATAAWRRATGGMAVVQAGGCWRRRLLRSSASAPRLALRVAGDRVAGGPSRRGSQVEGRRGSGGGGRPLSSRAPAAGRRRSAREGLPGGLSWMQLGGSVRPPPRQRAVAGALLRIWAFGLGGSSSSPFPRPSGLGSP